MARSQAQSRAAILTPGRLRFALLFDGQSLEPWHVRCLEHLEPVAELAGVIVAPAQPAGRRSRLLRRYAPALDVTDRLAQLPRLTQTAALDFVLQLGRVVRPTGVEARHGVWCFEHELDGEPLPFLREVSAGEYVTRTALLADGATVLEEGYFPTPLTSYRRNKEPILDAVARWPARVCGRIAAAEPVGARVGATPRRVFQSTRHVGLMRFKAALARRRFALAWRRLFRHPQWNIGVLNASAGALLAPYAELEDGIEWFPLDGKKGFLADPFAIARDDNLDILCEYFGYREGRGHVCALAYTREGFTTDLTPVLPLPVHVSYPYLLDSSKIYCVPETSVANEVALFEATDFPRTWSKVAVLVDDFPGVDPTVFRHDDRWWLMCTQAGPLGDTELWVWHASELLGPWLPHAQNPVKTDVRSSRPAGPPFVVDGVLYRPAQDCSRRYGWRVAVQRVTRLTPAEFSEEPASVLQAPARSPYPDGRHTLAVAGDRFLVDGLRTVFVWAAFYGFLEIWARDVARRLRR